ncbi:NAD(P)/FAD-dependent oxidoreductase [Natribaculum luteum]|uniref:NAD(P)/FAD-dependent oxidoreductase n=1 Tax=Natribaculum luteum TaxID=1586232 RepID=A0ABD5P3I0_9EURY|nr:FAD-dependent oxidoreductase [Natribaculum luteum]
MSAERRDVVVVGGGVVGCAAARWLAPDHDVLLLESDQIAGDASGKASGLVTNGASFRAHPKFARTAADFFPKFDGTGSFTFTERESVGLVAEGSGDWARDEAERMRASDFSVEFADVPTLEDRYPDVFDLDAYEGALIYHDTGWLDPYTYTVTLADGAADRGADVRTGVRVTDLLVDDGAVVGVESTDGTVHADTVVAAAGWRTRELCLPHLELPVRPFRWQAATLDPGRDIPDWYPMGWDPTVNRYWRPEHNGSIHIGGGEAAVTNPGSRRTTVPEDFKLQLATEMPDRLRHLKKAMFVCGDTCLTGDASTPDTYPIIDAPSEGPENLVVATGLHIGGIMSSPAIAEAVRSLVTGEELTFSLDPFCLDRFDTRSADFPFVRHMAETEITEARIEARKSRNEAD